ncbi:alpha/beta hydrolase [Nocardioides panacisoli]|uniref:alpha/beta fold hydrolase n=1 Tax=Nocardioides panacisoli TaxID=627624 RepID=UPI001C62821E|nr:alpha/beta hydrolase [Nocardioides panacisoli]QYJ02585.1 alpha/beta hydrolase [Nocardioides panacisoli]
MGRRGRILGSIAAGLGVAAAGTTVGVLRQRRSIGRRAGEDVTFGALRAEPRTVVADDGVPLHVEVDEVDAAFNGVRSAWRGNGTTPPVTVVFVHGFCLNLDCWHFQRAAYRDLVRTVYYDQRSHGRSGRSDRAHATIDQLGADLRAVIDATAPEGPVVLVGHSMGGMSIVAFAEQYPELIGDRIVGVGLISTTAGGLDPARLLVPLVPAHLTATPARRAMSALRRGHRAIDLARRVGASLATVAVDRFAFGAGVPERYVEFVDDMLAATPFEVVAEFFGHFQTLDKFDVVDVLSRVPTTIVCGTADRVTSIGHSRKLQSRIEGSRLTECEGAGHLVILEQHDRVNAELDQLITAATTATSPR